MAITVIDPTIDLVSVGEHIKYEYVAKRGRIQLWYGVVFSTDPDAERHATHIGAARSAAGGMKSCADVDTECHATTTATTSKPVEKRRSEPASGIRCSTDKKRKAVLPVGARLPSGYYLPIVVFGWGRLIVAFCAV